MAASAGTPWRPTLREPSANARATLEAVRERSRGAQSRGPSRGAKGGKGRGARRPSPPAPRSSQGPQDAPIARNPFELTPQIRCPFKDVRLETTANRTATPIEFMGIQVDGGAWTCPVCNLRRVGDGYNPRRQHAFMCTHCQEIARCRYCGVHLAPVKNPKCKRCGKIHKF